MKRLILLGCAIIYPWTPLLEFMMYRTLAGCSVEDMWTNIKAKICKLQETLVSKVSRPSRKR